MEPESRRPSMGKVPTAQETSVSEVGTFPLLFSFWVRRKRGLRYEKAFCINGTFQDDGLYRTIQVTNYPKELIQRRCLLL